MTKQAVAFTLLAAFAFFPIWLPLFVCEVTDCSGLNEGNSALASLPWLIFFTVPAAAGVLLLYFAGVFVGYLIKKFFDGPS